MNWKQLYALATPQERLEAVLLMLQRLEARQELVVVTIDLRRILMRVAFIGILGMLTLTTAFITLQAEPDLAVPILTAYLATLFAVFAFKPRRTAPVIRAVHYV